MALNERFISIFYYTVSRLHRMVFPPWMKKQETDTSATPEQDVSTPKTTVQEENTARLWQHEQRITALELIIEDIRDKVLRKIQQPKRRY